MLFNVLLLFNRPAKHIFLQYFRRPAPRRYVIKIIFFFSIYFKEQKKSTHTICSVVEENFHILKYLFKENGNLIFFFFSFSGKILI